jgi:uncharacterized oxidoreductase
MSAIGFSLGVWAVKIKGKLAVVTGGTSGIGLEIARQMRDAGSRVIVAARSSDRLSLARSEGLEAISSDLSTPDGCDTLCEQLAGYPVDILINNAGIDPVYLVDQTIDSGAIDRAIYLNLNAPIRLISKLLPSLLARSEAAIVNVTSGLAIAPSASTPVYCATKAGMRSFTLALRAQLAASSIKVIEALPPMVDTEMTSGIEAKNKMPPKTCASAIVAAIVAGDDEANIGDVRWLRKIYSLSPSFARRIMIAS